MLKKREQHRANYAQSPPIKNPLPKFESKALKLFHSKYDYTQCNYITSIVDNLIFNKNTHLVSVFKDHMIYDYKDEFLKREYSTKESLERVPRFAAFYKNYLKFFCKALFKDFYLNELVQEHGKNCAELFYNQNFKGKFEGDDLIQDNEIDIMAPDESDIIVDKNIFDTTVKNNIDNNPIITNNNSFSKAKQNTPNQNEYNEASLTLNNETFINDSGLLAPYSSEQSILSIMRHLKKRSNKQPKASKQAYVVPNIFKKSKENKESKSNLLAYTKLCNEHLIKTNALKCIQNFNTKSQAQIKEISKVRSRNLSSKIEFKTYDPNNKKSLIKTQNIENIINRITHQMNRNIQSKNIYSIDQSNTSKGRGPPTINFKTKSLCNLTKNHRSSSKNNLYTASKGNSRSHHKVNSTNDLKHSSNHNDDMMKITLAFLVDNNKQIKNSTSHSRVPGSSKNFQNVNININNHININNNVNLQDNLSSKQIAPKLLKNDRVEVNIQSNLTKLLKGTKTGLSRNRDNSNSTAHRNGDSLGKGFQNATNWNNTLSNNNKNIIFSSCSNLEKLKNRNYSRNKTNNSNNLYQQPSKSPSKTIAAIPKSKVKFTTNQLIRGIKNPNRTLAKYNYPTSLHQLIKKN